MILDFEEFLAVFFAGILPVLLIAFCNWRIFRHVSRRSPDTALLTARRCMRFARFAGTIAGTATIVGVGGFLIMSANGALTNGRDSEEASIMGLVGLVGLLLSLAQIPAFQVSRLVGNLVDDNQENLELSIDRAAGSLERMGWGAFIIAVLGFCFLIPILLPIGVLAVLIGVCSLSWQRKRARESQLLWVLALAARHNRDFGKEVRLHARGWTGFHACRLRELTVYLESGRSLGFALQMVPNVLPRWCVSDIRAAEEAGTLTEILSTAATGHVVMMRERFRSGSPAGLFFYGVGYLTLCMGIVSFLMLFIVPKMKAIFEGFGLDLPWMTVGFIGVSDFCAAYFYLFGWFPFLIAWIAQVDHRGWYSLKLRLFSWFYPLFDSAGILRHLAHAIDRDRTVGQAFLSLANCHYRPTVAEAMARVYVSVESGEDPWRQLHRGRFLSRRDLAVIQTAEKTGNLAWALREIAALTDRRNMYRVELLVQYLRPVLVLGLGAVVAYICIAMFLPLIDLVGGLS